ncbi:multidrug effflux MFS transporter [uncultured Sneathiella sp.]|jgi:Bcr/CflA subfamily drug resistance transporter|uniref:multidrug effflux MFS transporter n=1 Tax=uncultured Sneathiella sp. TaxID=879315 RepID=UPI0030D9D3F9|tara:strand:+ start:6293 stop:7483 length:1191 start_codon:yes stop_codon:yes gene_type:complete
MPFAATTPPRMITLVIFTALSTLSLNMFLPSLANMARDFEAEYALLALAFAGYLGITAVLMLILGPLSDRYGRRPVMLAALTIFIIASLVCTLAPNVWVFLAFRVLQGVVIAGWAIALAVVRDTSEPQEAARRISLITMAMSVAPLLGPMLGGVLDELFGWRASFATYTLFGVIALLLCWTDLGETNRTRSENFRQQFRNYPDLLKSAKYWDYAACMAFSNSGFYIFLAGVPLVAVVMLGLSPAMLGVCMGTITIGFTFSTFLSSRLAHRVPLVNLILAGRLSSVAGSLSCLLFFLADMGNAYTLFGPLMLIGVGNGLTMPNANAGAMSIRPDLAGSAVGLMGALAVGCGGALTALTGMLVSETSGAIPLLTLLLVITLLSLVAGIHLKWLDRRIS